MARMYSSFAVTTVVFVFLIWIYISENAFFFGLIDPHPHQNKV